MQLLEQPDKLMEWSILAVWFPRQNVPQKIALSKKQRLFLLKILALN